MATRNEGIVVCTPAEMVAAVPDQVVTGPIRLKQVSPALGADFVQITYVEYDAGARFRPHAHPHDQVLVCIRGTGVVAIDGGPDILVPEGGLVFLPKNVPHMHGCTEDGPAVHLSLVGNLATEFFNGGIEAWKQWMPLTEAAEPVSPNADRP